MLPAYRPVPTHLCTMACFLSFGIIFLILGITLQNLSDNIQQREIQYDLNCPEYGVECQVNLRIDETIEGPVFFYYELSNFYQNHRRYVKSRSYAQLAGEEITMKEAEDSCEPAMTNAQMGKTVAFDGVTTLEPDAVAYPCGLIAKSLFNDTFDLYLDNQLIIMDQSDIAWKSDVEYKFRNQAGDWQSKQWADVEDQAFIVWMRVAGLPQFRKLYGAFHSDL